MLSNSSSSAGQQFNRNVRARRLAHTRTASPCHVCIHCSCSQIKLICSEESSSVGDAIARARDTGQHPRTQISRAKSKVEDLLARALVYLSPARGSLSPSLYFKRSVAATRGPHVFPTIYIHIHSFARTAQLYASYSGLRCCARPDASPPPEHCFSFIVCVRERASLINDEAQRAKHAGCVTLN